MKKFFSYFEAIVSGSLMLLMCIAIVLQVFFRYCLGASLDWPEELGRYLFIAAVYIGCSYAEQEDKHLSINILRTNGGRFLGKYLPLLAPLVTASFCVLMVVWGIKMTIFVHASRQVMPALQLPIWLLYASLPFGMAFWAYRAIRNFLRQLKQLAG